jgi:CheY-like chemotaxis protein
MKTTEHSRQTRILIVDDEASFTRLLRLNLYGAGNYLVRTVNQAGEALATACGFTPDIVFMDVMMPGFDGGALAARFREEPILSRVPIVFLTAAVTPWELEIRKGWIGGLPFLRKPVEMSAVIDCIERACRTAPGRFQPTARQVCSH